MFRRITIPGESIAEEETDTDDTDTASRGDIGESSPSSIISLASPAHTCSYGKAKKRKDRVPFYKGFKDEGVLYLPGDINGLARELQLLAAGFFAGNTTVKNELVHVLDALLRLKQLTRKEYTIWNCKHDWIASHSVCNKSHVGYSCKDGTERFTESSQESHSTFDCT